VPLLLHVLQHPVRNIPAGHGPVVPHLPGVYQAGGEVDASHTVSLAGSSEIWDSLMRQTGAIRVYSLEEMVDLLVTFSLMPLPKGRNVGISRARRWGSVLATDELTLADRVPGSRKRLVKELMGSSEHCRKAVGSRPCFFAKTRPPNRGRPARSLNRATRSTQMRQYPAPKHYRACGVPA